MVIKLTSVSLEGSKPSESSEKKSCPPNKCGKGLDLYRFFGTRMTSLKKLKIL